MSRTAGRSILFVRITIFASIFFDFVIIWFLLRMFCDYICMLVLSIRLFFLWLCAAALTIPHLCDKIL